MRARVLCALASVTLQQQAQASSMCGQGGKRAGHRSPVSRRCLAGWAHLLDSEAGKARKFSLLTLACRGRAVVCVWAGHCMADLSCRIPRVTACKRAACFLPPLRVAGNRAVGVRTAVSNPWGPRVTHGARAAVPQHHRAERCCARACCCCVAPQQGASPAMPALAA